MSVLSFLSSTAGRRARAGVGVALVGTGAALGGWWSMLAVVGAVFVLVGALDVCLLAPLAGKPLRGVAFRVSAQL